MHVFIRGDDYETLYVSWAVEDVTVNRAYCFESIFADAYVGFTLTDDADSIPADTYLCEDVKIDGETHWFYVDYIEAAPRE